MKDISSHYIAQLIGLGGNRTGHAEKWLSALGGFCGIVAVLAVSEYYLGLAGAAVVVASMGASAVLLFAVPHGPLSQPWAVLAGHLVSAFIGVSCIKILGPSVFSAALAVGLAIGAMHYLRCTHPPGGATALSAVVGGDAVYELGYQFVLTPVLLNVLIILLVALVFNYPLRWRRYPVYLMRFNHPEPPPPQESLLREDIEQALRSMDTLLDVSDDDLEEIFRLARQFSERDSLKTADIHLGAYYTNGEFGPAWQVRRVIDMETSGRQGGSHETVIYKVIAGQNRRSNGTASRQQFAEWAHYEVFLNENSWQRVRKSRE